MKDAPKRPAAEIDSPHCGRSPAAPGKVFVSRTSTVLTVGLLVTAVVLMLTIAASIMIGSRAISIGTIIEAWTNYRPGDIEHTSIRELRLPRTIVGILVGAALGLAGAVMQGVTRNPLAEPGIMGVNAGSSLAVVIGIAAFGLTGPGQYVWLAFVGAGIVCVAVFAIAATGRDGATPVRLALVGAAVTAGLFSITTTVLLLQRSTFQEFRFWEVGSLVGRDLGVAAAVLPFIAVGIVLAFGLGGALNGLALGVDTAQALGHRVNRTRWVAIVCVVLLSGAATAAAGPITFLGLIVPQMARVITGPNYRWILAYSVLLGPLLVLAADIVGRVLITGEIQVGVMIALIGAPLFIGMVRSRKLGNL